MVDRPLVDPPRPPPEEQRRMLVELGGNTICTEYRDTNRKRRDSQAQSSITKAGCLPGRSSKTSTQYPLTVMGLTRSHSNPTAAYMGQGLEPSHSDRLSE